jgi:protein transport protein SEC61 subunit gamma-like protein
VYRRSARKKDDKQITTNPSQHHDHQRHTMYEPIEQDESLKTRMRRFITQCIRVLKITKRPDKDEYRMLVKVSGLGIAVIGFIGFLLHVLWVLLGLTPK